MVGLSDVRKSRLPPIERIPLEFYEEKDNEEYLDKAKLLPVDGNLLANSW